MDAAYGQTCCKITKRASTIAVRRSIVHIRRNLGYSGFAVADPREWNIFYSVCWNLKLCLQLCDTSP